MSHPHTSPDFAAVVFDMDGTLIDSEPLYREAIFAAAAELGYAMTDQLHQSQVGVPTDGSQRLFEAEYGTGFPFETFRSRMHALMAEIEAARGVDVKPGARDLLALLRQRGIPAAIVTSTTRPAAIARLTRTGLIDQFSTVVTRSDVANGKPHPEPFLTAAARLGVAPGDCLAVEDSPTGVRAARAAGMVTVMVPDMVRPDAETLTLCDAVHDDLGAVRRAFFPERAA